MGFDTRNVTAIMETYIILINIKIFIGSVTEDKVSQMIPWRCLRKKEKTR